MTKTIKSKIQITNVKSNPKLKCQKESVLDFDIELIFGF